MTNGLSAMNTAVIYNSVAVGGKAELGGDFGNCLKYFRDINTVFGIDFVGGFDMLFRHNHNVIGSLRLNIVKSINKLVLINLF